MGDNRTNNIVETRYGICVKPERISAAATAGFDYVELDLRYIFSMNGKAWLAMASEMQKANIRAEVVSGILPPETAIIGENVSRPQMQQALQRSFGGAKLLGAELMVFDCEPQRILPEGFDPVAAWRQMGDFLRMLQDQAVNYGMRVALLPLRRSAVDLMHYVSEATLISAMLQLENIGVAASSYNMAMESEALTQLQNAGSLLWHVRAGNVLGNRLPHRADGEDYRPLLETLAKAGYAGRISCEGSWRNFEIDAAEALICMKTANRK